MDSGRPGRLGAEGEGERRDNNDPKVFQED